MTNLPRIGDKVKIWPARKRVQMDARGIGDEQRGRALADEGQEVVWSYFHLESYRAGDFYLHDPKPAELDLSLEEVKPQPEPEPEALPLAAPTLDEKAGG